MTIFAFCRNVSRNFETVVANPLSCRGAHFILLFWRQYSTFLIETCNFLFFKIFRYYILFFCGHFNPIILRPHVLFLPDLRTLSRKCYLELTAVAE